MYLKKDHKAFAYQKSSVKSGMQRTTATLMSPVPSWLDTAPRDSKMLVTFCSPRDSDYLTRATTNTTLLLRPKNLDQNYSSTSLSSSHK